MVKYLKKKRLYQIAKSLIIEDIPLCNDFTYRFRGGCEWLEGGKFKISSQCFGGWIRIEYCNFDEIKEDYVVSYEIFSNKKDDKYLYHSVNGAIIDI